MEIAYTVKSKGFFSVAVKKMRRRKGKERKETEKRAQKNSSEEIGRHRKLKGSINKKRAAIAYRNHYVYTLHTRSQHNDIFTHSLSARALVCVWILFREQAFFQRFVSAAFFLSLALSSFLFLFAPLTLDRAAVRPHFPYEILFSANICCSPVTFVYQPNDHLCTFSIFLMEFFFFFFLFAFLMVRSCRVVRLYRCRCQLFSVFFPSPFHIFDFIARCAMNIDQC